MSAAEAPWLASLPKNLQAQLPFSLLSSGSFDALFSAAELRSFRPGQRLLRPDELPDRIFLVLKGSVRLLALGDESDGQITLDKRGPGQLLGWVGFLRGGPCEFVQASTDVQVLALPVVPWLEDLKQNSQLQHHFAGLANIQEAYSVAVASALLMPRRPSGWRHELKGNLAQGHAALVPAGPVSIAQLKPLPEGWQWLLSTAGVPGVPVGTVITDQMQLPARPGYQLPYRLVALPALKTLAASEQVVSVPANSVETLPVSLHDLGILEDEKLVDDQRFPVVRGRGQLQEAMSVCEMVALHQRVPFRRDAIEKVLEAQFERDKGLSLELIGGLCELLGLHCQLAEVDRQHLTGVEAPAVLFWEGIPVVFYGSQNGRLLIANPHHGIQRIRPDDLLDQLPENCRFVSPRRTASTPTTRFGWSWFFPLIGKYRLAFSLVFVASLLAQCFGLAIPLLLQQIIDKVLTQGNTSSLNVLGSAMIVMALFQGILMVLRTFIFVDTTDRMDLTLGSAVIDRLLSLPLNFFEKRPVGELSQRLGELGTIRNFLTGTALISVLNIIFATIYLLVMFLYSPLLSVVALSTLPLYILLVFVVAPVYKGLIRKRAIAQARTQSHLIEVLGGIQTVKAQHFELTARWKWQDRYRVSVEEGFKSTAVGATAGEIGNFLNQLSGLLVLWIGMGMVLKGELTLGMLIAFRIIAGNVTGPLLQLSNLYQGFQGVQLAMERLGDILDQNPELNDPELVGQISLPPIVGNVRFENISFRFGAKGAKQLDDVSVQIDSGSFVGIVGQSGSGKSTLMKLLPRLYEPLQGRIFIDDYDICKVDLSSLRRQIGIVPQDSLLFEGTVSENIALNDPQASSESIIQAAKIACAHDFIMALGQGYATPLAERGANLSGGQRQRLAIARTILANPQLLVMDEATSALDYDTERQLCLNLQDWAQNRTVFFITHRLSTIQNSDLILVMHQGRLSESGTHQQLMDLDGRYAVLYRQQEMSAS